MKVKSESLLVVNQVDSLFNSWLSVLIISDWNLYETETDLYHRQIGLGR